MLSVGIPKEIKPLEKRVGLVPSAVLQLTNSGVSVYVEHAAGEASGFSDEDYKNAGAKILPDAKAVYGESDIIQKVKEPLEPEYSLLEEGQILFCFLHLASPQNCALVESLVRSGATAIGYETVEVDGRFPILAPMSEIAGALAVGYGAWFHNSGILEATKLDSASIFRGLEKIAASYPHFDPKLSPGKVVIFGGGVAGFKAMEVALKLNGHVTLIEKNPERREFLKRFTSNIFSPDENVRPHLAKANLLIGCVHSRGARAAEVLTKKMFDLITKSSNKIIVDVAIDQGGNFPESGPTTYSDPVYFDSGHNLRFGVTNMPSLCGPGASEALSRATLPYTLELARNGEGALKKYPELEKGINIRARGIELAEIREAHRRK